MKASIALGNFDGVHKAHGRLIKTLCSLPGESIVYTFDKHPREMLEKNVKLLMSSELKEETLLSLGVDKVYFEHLTMKILNMSPENFIKDLLLKRFRVGSVVAGFNYRFGAKAEGNAETLKELGKKHDFDVYITDEISVEGKTLSSTLLRNLLSEGEIEKYNEYSERPYTIRGKVMRGKGLGRKMGFPTINIEIPDSMQLPKSGVYAGKVNIEGEWHSGITNIGTNPTVENARIRAECHIMNYSGDLYNKTADIILLSRIRDERKFENTEELKEQIIKDKAFAEMEIKNGTGTY